MNAIGLVTLAATIFFAGGVVIGKRHQMSMVATYASLALLALGDYRLRNRPSFVVGRSHITANAKRAPAEADAAHLPGPRAISTEEEPEA